MEAGLTLRETTTENRQASKQRRTNLENQKEAELNLAAGISNKKIFRRSVVFQRDQMGLAPFQIRICQVPAYLE